MKRRATLLRELRHEGLHPVLLASNGTVPHRECAKLSAGIPTGEWFVIGPSEVQLHPNVWEVLAHASHQRPDIGIFYGDDVATTETPNLWDLGLKPEWDLTMLLANDYVKLPLFVRSTAAQQIGALDPEKGTAASYDFLLRAHAVGVTIGRIPEVLAKYTARRFCADSEDRKSVIKAWWSRTADAAIDVEPGLTPGSLRIAKRFPEIPEVTLIVPTRQTIGETAEGDGIPFVLQFLKSVSNSNFPMNKLHVLVGDDIESDAIYDGHQWPFNLRRIVTKAPVGATFNYAAKMNQLWRESATECVILMNDDITVRSPDWIQALLTFSTQTDVGGTGARLLYPTGEIQHAGIAGGVFGLCTHAWIGEAALTPTYQDWALVQREWSMVTGAVFATRKSLLEEINGFDEKFRLDFNDIDMCLRLKMLGYRIIYTPHAELVHHEKGSRGDATWLGSELSLFLRRWEKYLGNDPSFHPKLSRYHHKLQPAEMHGEWWQTDTLRIAG